MERTCGGLYNIVAEAITFLVCRHEGNKIVKFSGIGKHNKNIAFGVLNFSCFVTFALDKDNMALYTILTVIFSIAIYAIIEIVLKMNAC